MILRSLATDATSKLDVLWHDGHTLGMDSTKVSVFEETDEVGLSSLLQGEDSRGLETEIGLEVLGDLTNETLEWELADEELSGLLVASDLTESDGTWSVSVWLLDTTSSLWGRLTCGLSGEGLSWGLATSGLI
eukprot:GEZU01026438.1.p1 GENE.GEZU01026438.1~~GEZU01026438.1.p1  ORF type:complete len:133 (-),score=6.65 GEZU01026438.1:125-523(-)